MSVKSKTVQKTIVSHDLMEAEMTSRGYDLRKLALQENFTCYTSPSGRSWLTRDATLSYPFVTGSARLICKDKQLSQLFAISQGVAVPETLTFPQEKSSINQFLADYSPLVVKPIDSFGSRGLTLNITDEHTLRLALDDAWVFSEKVLMQRQFSGQEIRITICRGVVVAVILRQTPRVIGDGKSTIAELIVQENKLREHLIFPYIAYPQLTNEIIPDRFINDNRVPAKGEIVELSKSTLVRTGASLYNLIDTLHESYKTTAIKLANILNHDFLTVDVMVKDYLKPQSPKNYIFLEFTTSPALKMYYGLRDGKHYDIVSKLADMIDEYCTR
jgi:D-alanine-D-alanine ligase-like ATP-grasp enzyme